MLPEITKIENAKFQIGKEYDMNDVWEAFISSDFVGLQDYVLKMDCDWTKPGAFPVIHLLESGEGKKTTIVTLDMLREGFIKMINSENPTHCGGYPLADLEDPDACFAYELMQYAIYGKSVFG